MQIIYTPEHQRHAPPFEVIDGRVATYFESPQRAELIRAALLEAGSGPISAPREFGLESILAVHDQGYVTYLENAYARWVAHGGAPEGVLPTALPLRELYSYSPHPLAQAGYYCYDLSAMIVAGTYAAARASADAALTGAALLLEGAPAAYALCRPPGHHAHAAMCGGYCFLNNAAIAADYLVRSSGAASAGAYAFGPAVVAVLDIDYHHGNGTQAIFYERSDVLFVSIHADPAREYPYFAGGAAERGAGAGTGYNLNLPLAARIDDTQFLAALTTALDAIAAYSPRYLVVSAGFDTFVDDPLGDFQLSSAAYSAVGARIAALGLPTLFVQEGGYAVEALGRNVVSLLGGFDAARSG